MFFSLLALTFASPFVHAVPWGPWHDGGNPKWHGFDRPGSSHQAFEGGVTTDVNAVADKSFDYVICGGGLTGLTVASRLSEDPNISVLVIEAGYDNHNDPRVYDVRTYGEAFESELDWNITSTPVPWQNETGLLLVAGRTLGGSGSINGASWTKGPASQYDVLPLLTGDDSWGWKGLNEYMLIAENFNLPEPREIASGAMYDPAYHGQGGPVEVSFAAGIFEKPQQDALEASYKVWEGLERIDDAAAGEVNGATIIPNMVVTDESQNRSSPFTAYAMHQVEQRDNFMILTGQRVTEIVWKEGDDMVAEGVHFQGCRDCDINFVKADREVLLSAGSLQSPQILELSGVGDPDVLEAAGVPLKKAAPGVGKHMQEQTKNSVVQNAQEMEYEGSGPPSGIAFPNVHQLLKDNSSATYDYVMETLPGYCQELQDKGLVANAKATHTILEAQVNNLFKQNAAASEVFFTVSPGTGQLGIDLWNLIVLARGTAHISSNNSWDRPTVEASYFGHPLDMMIQRETCKQSREVYQTEPLAQYVKSEIVPGEAVAQEGTDEEWEQWMKETFTSVWHYIATLAMMKEEYGGVVDNRLKIYGIENVRAIDASVLPIQLSAHLSSSLYGIAEKAAAMIKEDQKGSREHPWAHQH
ncbi:GMC oxidoreductase [Hortaea werneckii]|nr:GMC oxidoreductase [Hortaea werneckii]KAI7315384.1 GMC oxidoreductase [Hortaea werneckii]